MASEKTTSRRDFIKKAGLSALSFTIVPRFVLGGKGYTAPSDRLLLGCIGAGGKGSSDIRNAWNNGSESVIAICDIDKNQAGESIKRFEKAKFYSDFRRMLDEVKDIDAVTISTPDHTHAIAALDAMRRGKHVYVQKPLTNTIEESRLLTEAARKYRVVTQMGNQGASQPGQQQMIDWFSQGLIGTVSEVYVWTDRPVWPQGIPFPKEFPSLPAHLSQEEWDLFIGPARPVAYHPLFHPFKWRGWWDFGTGALGDMGCHLIDPPYRVLGLGYPTEVECSVGQVFTQDWVPEYIPEGCPPSTHVQLTFGPTTKNPRPITLTWYDGGIRPFHPSLIPPDHDLGEKGSRNGVMMIGDKGIMTCGVYGLTPKVYLRSGEIVNMPKDYVSSNPYASNLPDYGHQVLWTEAIKAGYDSKEHRSLTSSFDYAGPLTETVLMGNLAIRSYQQQFKDEKNGVIYPGRQRLLWNGLSMKITNYEAANQFVGRTYRKGWELPNR